MDPNNNTGLTNLGFYSTDGFFYNISSVTSQTLEFVSKSRLELETILQENILLERYEKCAVIRDELLKRAGR